MNSIEKRLNNCNPKFYASLEKVKANVELLLQKYISNFPSYTDHSLKHTEQVFQLAADLMIEEEINQLNEDEIYVLACACLLHDIGMCIPPEKLNEISKTADFMESQKSNPTLKLEDFIRNIHHELSYEFINKEWEHLGIVDSRYANAIAIVAKGHRKVNLSDLDVYKPKYFVKSGREFVCLPYLAAILRVADELDVTNIRTPYLLTKYYMPNNDQSRKEWEKHIATTQINFSEEFVRFEVTCSNQDSYSALEHQFEKIKDTLNDCQKVIRTISNTDNRRFSLKLMTVKLDYIFLDFDPKGIKFSFNVPNVIEAFIGENLYKNRFIAIREGIQNAIDSCNYKKLLVKKDFKPKIQIIINSNTVEISDNGLGMDEFIIENYFGKLGSSFYQSEEIKKNYTSIGHFGVGVFSYFLISDYIDIETKNKNSRTLKFRIDKDPKSYFHFYNVDKEREEGTTITLHLKEEQQKNYNYSTISEFIRKNFGFLDIEVTINSSTETEEILDLGYKKLSKEEITKYLKIHKKKEIENITLITTKIDNEKFEGECGIVLYRDSDGNIKLNHRSDIFDQELIHNQPINRSMSNITLYQKGVYVQDYGTNYFEFIFGRINIKEKLKLNINRNEFGDYFELCKIIWEFEKKLIELILDEIEKLKPQNIVKVYQDFLLDYSNSRFTLFRDELKDTLQSRIFFNTKISEEHQILSLKQITEYKKGIKLLYNKKGYDTSFGEIMLVSIEDNNEEYTQTRRLDIILTNLYELSTFIDLEKGVIYRDKNELEFNTILKKAERLIFHSNSIIYTEDLAISEGEYIYFVNSSIHNGEHDTNSGYFYLNLSSPFMKFVLGNIYTISANRDYSKAIESILNVFSEIIWKEQIDEEYVENATQTANKIISHIPLEFPEFKKDLIFQYFND